MRTLWFIVILAVGCLIASDADAANVVRAFTCLTGGTTGCLDKIDANDAADGDIAIVVTGNKEYVFQFNAAATDAEDTVDYKYIRPNYAVTPGTAWTAGVWYLVTAKALALDSTRTATPCINFFDSDATDYEVNGKVCLQCTATGSGAEDCYFYVETQRGGTSTEHARIGSGAGITGEVKLISAASSCTIGADCDGTSVDVAKGGTILATAAITVTLPEIVSAPSTTQVKPGASICIIARDAAEALVIDPHANDSITLDGTKDTAGNNITATGAGAFACLLAIEADNWMVMGTSGSWSAE